MIRTIEIANPSSDGNLLNPVVIQELVAALTSADDDQDIDGLILTGSGDVFCAGLDIPAIRAGGNPVEFAQSLVGLLKLFPQLRTPVAAAVNGDAVASGASLVAAVDYAVIADTAVVGTREVGLGIWPMVAQVPVIQRIGPRWAMENVGSGEPFTARRALEVGLVNAIAPVGDVKATAELWLQKAVRGRDVVAVGRPAFYRFATLGYDDALDASVELFAEMARK